MKKALGWFHDSLLLSILKALGWIFSGSFLDLHCENLMEFLLVKPMNKCPHNTVAPKSGSLLCYSTSSLQQFIKITVSLYQLWFYQLLLQVSRNWLWFFQIHLCLYILECWFALMSPRKVIDFQFVQFYWCSRKDGNDHFNFFTYGNWSQFCSFKYLKLFTSYNMRYIILSST